MEKVEKVVKTNFFHDSSRFGGPNRGKNVDFTNNFQDFCYQIHGNYWFQGRKHSKNLGQWGGYHIYIHIYIYMNMNVNVNMNMKMNMNMNINVCIYVCMYVGIHVFMYVCMYL